MKPGHDLISLPLIPEPINDDAGVIGYELDGHWLCRFNPLLSSSDRRHRPRASNAWLRIGCAWRGWRHNLRKHLRLMDSDCWRPWNISSRHIMLPGIPEQ